MINWPLQGSSYPKELSNWGGGPSALSAPRSGDPHVFNPNWAVHGFAVHLAEAHVTALTRRVQLSLLLQISPSTLGLFNNWLGRGQQRLAAAENDPTAERCVSLLVGKEDDRSGPRPAAIQPVS